MWSQNPGPGTVSQNSSNRIKHPQKVFTRSQCFKKWNDIFSWLSSFSDWNKSLHVPSDDCQTVQTQKGWWTGFWQESSLTQTVKTPAAGNGPVGEWRHINTVSVDWVWLRTFAACCTPPLLIYFQGKIPKERHQDTSSSRRTGWGCRWLGLKHRIILNLFETSDHSDFKETSECQCEVFVFITLLWLHFMSS